MQYRVAFNQTRQGQPHLPAYYCGAVGILSAGQLTDAYVLFMQRFEILAPGSEPPRNAISLFIKHSFLRGITTSGT